MKKVYLSPSNQYDNVGVGDYGTEKDRCEQIAKSVHKYLLINGVDSCIPTLTSMYDRVKEANGLDIDAYIPIHTNAGGGKGCEIFISNFNSKQSREIIEKSEQLAKAVYPRLSAITPSSDRGIKKDVYDFYEIREPKAPSIYIECMFHDNETDAKFIIENIDEIGKAIAHGVCDYFGINFVDKIEEDDQDENEILTKEVFVVSSNTILFDIDSVNNLQKLLTQNGVENISILRKEIKT